MDELTNYTFPLMVGTNSSYGSMPMPSTAERNSSYRRVPEHIATHSTNSTTPPTVISSATGRIPAHITTHSTNSATPPTVIPPVVVPGHTTTQQPGTNKKKENGKNTRLTVALFCFSGAMIIITAVGFTVPVKTVATVGCAGCCVLNQIFSKKTKVFTRKRLDSLKSIIENCLHCTISDHEYKNIILCINTCISIKKDFLETEISGVPGVESVVPFSATNQLESPQPQSMRSQEYEEEEDINSDIPSVHSASFEFNTLDQLNPAMIKFLKQKLQSDTIDHEKLSKNIVSHIKNIIEPPSNSSASQITEERFPETVLQVAITEFIRLHKKETPDPTAVHTIINTIKANLSPNSL